MPQPNATLLAQRIPGAQLRIIENARHFYFFEYRQQASLLVRDFLAQHPITPAA